MAEIIPAIIPEDLYDLEEKLALVANHVPLVQIDVTDGKFTPSQSWPLRKGGDDFFKKILNEEEGMPYWDLIDFEVHLMVSKPERMIPDWVRAGATRIIVHVETLTDFASIKNEVGEAVSIGLAINIDTSIESLAPYIKDIEVVQCMGIAKIGSQGQPFDHRVIERVRELREMYRDTIISVDGGVSKENASFLIEAGADRLVVGSAIFESGAILETIEYLKNL